MAVIPHPVIFTGLSQRLRSGWTWPAPKRGHTSIAACHPNHPIITPITAPVSKSPT